MVEYQKRLNTVNVSRVVFQFSDFLPLNILCDDELRSDRGAVNIWYLWIIQKMQPPEKCQNKCKKYGQIHWQTSQEKCINI